MSKEGAVRIYLKRRPVDDYVTIGLGTIRQALDQPNVVENIVAMLRTQASQPQFIHDKRQLEAIAYWMPTASGQGQASTNSGVSNKQDAAWYGLRLRINALKDDVQGYFTLNRRQYEQILARLNDPEFKIVRPSLQWSAFVADFMEADHQQFEGVSADLMEDFPFEADSSDRPEG